MSDVDASPMADSHDSLELQEGHGPHRRSEVGELLHAALRTMNGELEEEYQEAIQALTKRGFEAVIEIARQECKCVENDYATRWALVHIAAGLDDGAALPLLASIVTTPIPPERAKDPVSSTAAQETVIRTTAVDGVAALAARGDDTASKMLLDFLRIDSISIRRAAVQGLINSPRGDDYRDQIVRCLPKEQHFLLDLKRVSVDKFEQVRDPREHLSEAGKADSKSAAPDMRSRNQDDCQDRSPDSGKKEG